jgi:pyruvate dehydrogenase E1 component beta subunit
VRRQGSDITLVALSGTLPEAVAACEELAKENVSVELIDPRTLYPFDTSSLVTSLRKTGRMAVTHDGYRTCGVAAEISQRMMEEAFDYLDAPIARIGGLDVPVPSGHLHSSVVPNKARIVDAIRSLVN